METIYSENLVLKLCNSVVLDIFISAYPWTIHTAQTFLYNTRLNNLLDSERHLKTFTGYGSL